MDGVQQKPLEGVSLVYTFDNAEGTDTPHHAVFRDDRQSRNLQGRLDGQHDTASAAVGDKRL